MRLLFIGLLIVAVLACNKGDNIPRGVLERERMEAVLWDMIQADEFLKDFVLNKDTSLNDTLESIRMYERVFRFHKTSRETFDSSFSFYRSHPALMKEILDSLHAKSQQAGLPPQMYPVDTAARRTFDTGTSFPRIRRVLEPQ